MFKFKVSLLLKSLKFRVAMIVLLIAAIAAGIIFIPRNRAAEISQSVNIKAPDTGLTIGGHSVYVVLKDGDAKGYDKVFCISQDAQVGPTGYKTYQNPIDISKAKSYFKNYNSAVWLLNNMYITNITGSGISNETAKDVQLINLANILTTDTVKNSVKSKVGVDYSNITPQKIYNLKNVKIGSKSQTNAIEVIEQIALWNYTNNKGNTVSNAYKSKANEYIKNSNLTDEQQKTLKYMYYALVNVADRNANTAPTKTTTNQVVLKTDKAKYDENKKLVGPYYLQAGGLTLTSFSFGESKNAGYPIKITITNADGSKVNAGKEIVTKGADGNFYIDIASYKNARKVDFSISGVLSGVSTTTYVLNGGKSNGVEDQDILTVQKTIKATSLQATKEMPIPPTPGKYTVELVKVNADGKTIITSSEAVFKINGKEQKTSKGVLSIVKDKSIANEKQVDIYEITETKAPEGYELYSGTMKINVKFKKSGNTYVIDKENTTSSGFAKGGKVEISSDNTKIKVYVPNKEEEYGTFNVELHKVDEKGQIIKTPAKFKINGTEKTTKNGILSIASNVIVKDVAKVNTYTIQETAAPSNYEMYNGTITLKVKMSKTNNGFELKNDGITLETTNKTSKATFKIEGSTVKVYVPNKRKSFDLALRKYISKINGKIVVPSRAPIINRKSITMLEKTGNASYYHVKNSLGVSVGDEIEYTIRVYNEGEILGFAKQITDYLPEGLSFVKLADKTSKEYTTDSKVGSKVVVIKYSGNKVIKTLRDFIGKEVKVTSDYYQEVKIICKVESTEKVYITSRAEITNYGYSEKDETGKTVWKEATSIGNVDRDSVQNTIKDKLDLDTWYENAKENTYTDENGKKVVDKNYYPGTQDDDDFETVEVLTGKYNVIIKKVDSNDSKTALEGAYFSIAGSRIEDKKDIGPTKANGEVAVLTGVSIENDKQVDTYTIKETTAPYDYKLYDGEIKLKVATMFNGKNFVIDSKNTKVDGKNIKMSVNKDNTTITIIVPNTKKYFDLSLRKFITEVNGQKLTESREPQVDVSKLVSGESTTATYNHSKTPVDVNTSDIVTYTIRVYNEGEIDGYATKVMDDIPEGLVFIPGEYDKEGKPTNINAQYGWSVYREMKSGENAISENMIQYNGKSYVVTDKVEEADIIVTDCLSKDNGTQNLIKAFDSETMKQLDYKDVKVSFKVIEPQTSDRIIINYAQVTDDTDSNGKPVTDRDSTPNKWNDGEDDQDIEKIKVRYFDLSLLKWVTKAIVYENGVPTVTETKHTPYDKPEPIVKVDLKNTNLDNVEVKFEYSIRITNEGQIAGYAKEISDYIPQGLKFIAADNPEWTVVDGKIVTKALENTLLKPGEYADVKVILTWINGADNLGVKTNIAEISKDYNEYGTPDIDSTPNNKVPGEDDIDDASVVLTIKTGKPAVYAGLTVAVLAILTTGVVVIKKRVL